MSEEYSPITIEVESPLTEVIEVAGGLLSHVVGSDVTALNQHILSPTPHPAYDDDIPSLELLFKNGLI